MIGQQNKDMHLDIYKNYNTANEENSKVRSKYSWISGVIYRYLKKHPGGHV
jgi:hypothetical protein